jgi:hypothetical protein
MLIQFSALVLSSQLLIAAADNFPKFNIEHGCQADSTSASDLDLNPGLDEWINGCMKDERKARDQLQSLWSQFATSDRGMCNQETTDLSDVPPGYVELLTCLQRQQLEKKLKD